MKLLFDQNISFRIVKLIDSKYPGSSQVRALNLEGESDIKIWHFAKENEFTIVTFDADFYDLSNFRGHPPKIIWLRTGNTSTKNIAEILTTKYEIISDFLTSLEFQDIACLEIE
jgi:predicted nuclease of predicted toxin-antitoxin system